MIGLTLIIFFADAQKDFLNEANVNNLVIDKTLETNDQIVKEIEDQGTEFWYNLPLNQVYSSANSLMAEVHTDKLSKRIIGLWIIDTMTKMEKKVADGLIEDIKWSPSGKFLAYLKLEYVKDISKPLPFHIKREPFFNTEKLCVYNLLTNEIYALIRPVNCLGLEFLWSPTNDDLAYSYVDTEKNKYLLNVFDAENNQIHIIDELILCSLWNYTWSSNSEMLAYTKPLQMETLINEEVPLKAEIFISDRYGSQKKQLTNTPASELFVKWLPDGKNIITMIDKHPENDKSKFEFYNLLLKKKAGK